MPGRFLSESRHDVFVIKPNGHPSELSEVNGSSNHFLIFFKESALSKEVYYPLIPLPRKGKNNTEDRLTFGLAPNER